MSRYCISPNSPKTFLKHKVPGNADRQSQGLEAKHVKRQDELAALQSVFSFSLPGRSNCVSPIPVVK